jgi:hypothetical protein
MLPCIQIGYSGLEGTVHGADLHLADPGTVLDAVPRFVLDGLRRLGPCLDEVASYHETYGQYVAKVTQLGGTVLATGVESFQDLAQR